MTPINKVFLDHAENMLAQFVRKVAAMDGRKDVADIKREAIETLRATGWAK